MKKKFLISLFAVLICLTVVGCTKKNTRKEGGWELNLNAPNTISNDETVNIWNAAIANYTNMKLTPVAVIGNQVVAGRNYMFLAKTEDAFKVVVIYHDLEGKSTVTQVNDFDVLKYVNENISLDAENLSGGWSAYIPGKAIMLDEKMQGIVDKALEKIVGVTYLPVATLAEQSVSGTNYAVLCYGRMSDQNATEGVYLLTIYVDENNTTEVVSIASIKLSDYSK